MLRKIFALARELRLTDESRKLIILSVTNQKKDSAKLLTSKELSAVIAHLETLLNQSGKLSVKQKNYLHFLWSELNKLYNGNSMPFEDFIRERFGVGRIEDLTKTDANAAIQAIKTMIDQRKKNADKDYYISERKRKCKCGTYIKWVETRNGSRLPYELNEKGAVINIHECKIKQ